MDQILNFTDASSAVGGGIQVFVVRAKVDIKLEAGWMEQLSPSFNPRSHTAFDGSS